ncbi:hypothetical protein MTO96_000072 [Rhipicephalus appendiculatus]
MLACDCTLSMTRPKGNCDEVILGGRYGEKFYAYIRSFLQEQSAIIGLTHSDHHKSTHSVWTGAKWKECLLDLHCGKKQKDGDDWWSLETRFPKNKWTAAKAFFSETETTNSQSAEE